METSTYGSEMVAARLATEVAIEYRYMLRMLGVQLDGPCMMLGDNNSVVLNTTLPSSILKKKHNAIAYHCVCEAVAAHIIRFIHIPSTENAADVLTKPLSGVLFHRIIRPWLFARSWNTGGEQPQSNSQPNSELPQRNSELPEFPQSNSALPDSTILENTCMTTKNPVPETSTITNNVFCDNMVPGKLHDQS